MRAFIWVAIAIAIGVFFPSVGAMLLNPFWAIVIVVLLIGVVGEMASDEG